ncbi:MAG TPA: tetratricopeptide repeat protein [Opitutaceae bacterium]|nr:tetratricopeptide repeat protein [Opitutaceae bacterium]
MPESSVPLAAKSRGRSFATVGLGVALVVATFLAYWPALHGGPLIDDADHITRPEWRSLAGLARLWFDIGITSQYFPLLHSTFWLEYHLWQDAVVGYHIANVLQHILCALLVVALARRLGLPGGWLAGFVFALHPVCVDSVAWISEQKNTLSTLFALAAACVYLDRRESGRARRYWLASGLFVLALLTKSITATLAPALVVIGWWQHGRVGWRRDVRPLVPWMLIGAAQGLFTVWYERVYAHARGASFDWSPVERGLIAGRAVVFYLRTLVWPADLVFIQPRWAVNAAAGWQYVFPAAVVAFAVALAWLARRRRGPLAAFLIYAGALFPTLGFLNLNWFNYSFVADHFQYLALPALIIPAAALLTVLLRRWFAACAPVVAAALGVVLAIGLGGLTWRQSGYYRDAETLYRRTLAGNPSCWLAHANLGAILLDRPGGLEEAITHLITALSLKPDHLNAYINLGYAFSRLPGHRADAVRAFEGALQLKPDNPAVLTQLGHVLAQTPGRTDDAIATYRRALHLNPREWEAHAGLARLLAATPGGLPEAIAEGEAAIRLRPDFALLYSDLGGNLGSAGRTTEAIAAFETAVKLQPDLAVAQYNLGTLLSDRPGRLAEAVDHLEAARQRMPNDPAVHNNLGLALLQLGRRDEAIRELQSVLRLAPDSAEGHFSMGRALLGAPADYRAALREFERAARLRPDWPAAQEAVAQLRARLGP